MTAHVTAHVCILSSKHTYRPMRARVVTQLFYNFNQSARVFSVGYKSKYSCVMVLFTLDILLLKRKQQFFISKKFSQENLITKVIPYSKVTWSAALQIYLNKRDCLHKKRVQLPQEHGCCFIVLEHQYGCRDVIRKRSVINLLVLDPWQTHP